MELEKVGMRLLLPGCRYIEQRGELQWRSVQVEWRQGHGWIVGEMQSSPEVEEACTWQRLCLRMGGWRTDKEAGTCQS